MRFILHTDAGNTNIVLSGDEYKYIIKVRRHSIGDILSFRHRSKLEEEYQYRLESHDGRKAYFTLQSHHCTECDSEGGVHIGWCIIDPKTVEKVLPTLTEMGVAKITFIACSRSQRNFRFDFERFERIMESSIMQCGRTSLIELGQMNSVEEFLNTYADTVILDFGGEPLACSETFKTVLIGCEGGFDERERSLFANHRIRHLSVPMILRSESVAVAVASLALAR